MSTDRLAGSSCCIPELFWRPVKISPLCFRAIINHFNPKIESYAAVNHISQLSEDQVSQACDCLFILLSGIQVLWRALCSLQLVMCSSLRAEVGLFLFLVQMWMRGGQTRPQPNLLLHADILVL